MSWSRYRESAVEYWGPAATEGAVTPFSRYPRQDLFYNVVAYSHVVIGFSYLAVTIFQFMAKKGTPTHVKRGLIMKWFALCCIGGGWVLQIRHSWFSDPKVFEKHPVLFSLPFARAFVSAFGTSTVVSALNCYLVGVKDRSRMALPGGALHVFLLVLTSISLVVDVNAYVYIIGEMTITQPWSNYHWDMLVEMTVIGAVFPFYDGMNLFVLMQWFRTGNLNYVEHHVMNAVFTMSKTIAAVLLFSAHDAHYFWPHPGLKLWGRWAVQLIPQLMVLLPYILRIFRHVAASPYVSKMAEDSPSLELRTSTS